MRWRSRATGRAGRAAHCARIRDPDYVRSSGRDRGRLGTAGFPGARASWTLGGLPHRGLEARAPGKSGSTGGGLFEARPAQRSGGRRSGRRSRGRSRPVHAREAPGGAGGAPQRAASPPRGRGRWRIAPCSRSSRGSRRRRRAAPATRRRRAPPPPSSRAGARPRRGPPGRRGGGGRRAGVVWTAEDAGATKLDLGLFESLEIAEANVCEHLLLCRRARRLPRRGRPANRRAAAREAPPGHHVSSCCLESPCCAQQAIRKFLGNTRIMLRITGNKKILGQHQNHVAHNRQ